jgi:4-aminobutyrate aminotransferase-like enzyme
VEQRPATRQREAGRQAHLQEQRQEVGLTVNITRVQVAYFVNSGSEANDMAMMIARLYSGNYDLLTLRNGYHGTSPSTMGLLSHSTWKFNTPQVGALQGPLPIELACLHRVHWCMVVGHSKHIHPCCPAQGATAQ